jgi:ribosomal protein S6
MYILDTTIEEAEREEAIAALESHVVAQGGEVISTKDFGRRRLAFEIENHREGFYKILYFKGFGPCVEEVKHEMRLLPQVVRGTVYVANPKFMFDPEGELKAEAAAAAESEAQAEAEAEEAATEVVAEVEEAPAEEPAVAEAPAEEAPAEEAPAVAEAPAEEPVAEEAVVAEAPAEAAPAEEA